MNKGCLNEDMQKKKLSWKLIFVFRAINLRHEPCNAGNFKKFKQSFYFSEAFLLLRK